MHLKKIDAWIEVDGVALPEFEVKTDADGQTVRCWIPSKEGKNFVVKWSDERKISPNTGATYVVDGQTVWEEFMPLWGTTSYLEGKYVAHSTMALFEFAKVRLTDDESVATQDEKYIKALGSIEIAIEKGSVVNRRSAKQLASTKSPKSHSTAVLAEIPIYEKVKKAGCHRVTLGKRIERDPRPEKHWESDGQEPFRFIFQYTSTDMLHARGIIPATAPTERASPQRQSKKSNGTGVASLPKSVESVNRSPHASEEPREVEDEDRIKQLEAELAVKRLEAELLALKAKSKKRKSNDNVDGKAKKPKVEEIDSRLVAHAGEIIDLT